MRMVEEEHPEVNSIRKLPATAAAIQAEIGCYPLPPLSLGATTVVLQCVIQGLDMCLVVIFFLLVC